MSRRSQSALFVIQQVLASPKLPDEVTHPTFPSHISSSAGDLPFQMISLYDSRYLELRRSNKTASRKLEFKYQIVLKLSNLAIFQLEL